MFALVSRRSLLLTGVAAAAAGGGLGLAWHGEPAEGYQLLTPREVDGVEAMARILFPPGVFRVHGGDGGTSPMVDELLAGILDPRAVEGFRYLLRAIEIGTIIARGRSFSALSVEEGAEVLAIWASDDPFPRRLASDSFKVILGMGFFRRAQVMEEIGWRAGCFPHALEEPPLLDRAMDVLEKALEAGQ